MVCRIISKMFMLLALLLVTCQTVQVPVTHIRASENSIPSGVRQIAILPYEYGETLNPVFNYVRDRIPDQVAAKITSWGTYTVVERQRLQTLMKEGMLQNASILSDEEMERVGKIAEAQAIVVGKINNIMVEEQTIKKQFEVAQKDPDASTSTQIVEYDYLIRRVTVGITSEMLHIADKKKIVTDSYNYTYDSEKDPQVVRPHGFLTIYDASYYETQPQRVPAASNIIDNIAQECADSFLRKISAHPVNFNISLKSGSSPGMEQGLEWAKQGQYQSAIGEFQKATDDPKESADAWYNVGVCYEMLKNYSEAVKAYDKSNTIAPSSEAKEGIARIRKYNTGM